MTLIVLYEAELEFLEAVNYYAKAAGLGHGFAMKFPLAFVGYEAIHMIRKGQACWSAKVGLLHRFILGLFARRTELPIIYPDLWLDYKVATHPIEGQLHPNKNCRKRGDRRKTSGTPGTRSNSGKSISSKIRKNDVGPGREKGARAGPRGGADWQGS
jgi:hypothetical protein